MCGTFMEISEISKGYINENCFRWSVWLQSTEKDLYNMFKSINITTSSLEDA